MIRKTISSLLLLSGLCVWGAEPYYSCSFDAASEKPLDGWTCRGSGKTPKLSSSWSQYFPEGSEAYQVLTFPGVPDAAYSNSNTEEGGKVDEWLISPVINVSAERNSLLLSFREIAIGSIRPNDYDVYLSTGGNGAEDFTTLIHSGRPKGTTSSAVAITVCVPVTGYAGKDIRIAFVNRSGGTGLLGFTDIELADYNCGVTSLVPEFLSREEDVRLQFRVSATTPGECRGFTARLLMDGETPREYTSASELSKGFSETVTFTPDLHVSFGEKKEYTMEIAFADASLPTYTYTGSITCAEGFPGVCVMEEATGTWCPACVRGAASIERYSAEFPDQFFGIAVHERDPMTVEPYSSDLKNESKISSFPSGWFNRQIKDDPQIISHVRDFVSRRLSTSVAIDRVNLTEEDGKRRITVLYSPQLCYDTESANLRAVAVLTEDHCRGTSGNWGQKNGYAEATVESTGGPEWWPYFEFYSGKESPIPAAEMEYNHVAWGIYNDYDGADSNISTSWKAYTPQQYSISFDVPMQEVTNGPGVQNIDNTAVTVILLDGATGHVAGADRMKADEFNGKDPSGISAAGMADFRVSLMDGTVCVAGDGEASVEVFSMTGIRLGKDRLKDGACAIGIPTQDTPVIVRVVSGNHTGIYKLR